LEVAAEIQEKAARLATYRETLALAAEVLAPAGRLEQVEELAATARARPTEAGAAYLDEIEGRLALARDAPADAAASFRTLVEAAAGAGYRLVELRSRALLAVAEGAAGRSDEAAAGLRKVVEAADEIGARLIAREARHAAAELGFELPAEPEPADQAQPERVVPHGERLVTSLFADVRGSAKLGADLPPEGVAERMAMLYRLARVTVERRAGIVDKFAGDAVMATFNVAGNRIDHSIDALEAALALRDKAAMIDLPLGIGISVGPGILSRGISDDNIAVSGEATNLAARLQAAAGPGEILLSSEAHRRLSAWLAEHGLTATEEQLTLKGFPGPQVVHRILDPARIAPAC